MALDEGMALLPWGALGGGRLKTKAQREEIAKAKAEKKAET